MNRFSSLKNLLVDSLFVQLVPEHGKFYARLTEKIHGRKPQEVRVLGLHKNSILLKLDNVPHGLVYSKIGHEL